MDRPDAARLLASLNDAGFGPRCTALVEPDRPEEDALVRALAPAVAAGLAVRTAAAHPDLTAVPGATLALAVARLDGTARPVIPGRWWPFMPVAVVALVVQAAALHPIAYVATYPVVIAAALTARRDARLFAATPDEAGRVRLPRWRQIVTGRVSCCRATGYTVARWLAVGTGALVLGAGTVAAAGALAAAALPWLTAGSAVLSVATVAARNRQNRLC